jgi:hypothetical protein
MGGERETFVDKPAEKKNPPDDTQSMGSLRGTNNPLRIHESAGEVHFHDDVAKLKAAVPVSTWFKAWDKVSSQPQSWQFVDQKNKTVLTIDTKLEAGNLEADVTLSPLTVGTNFCALAKFTTKK